MYGPYVEHAAVAVTVFDVRNDAVYRDDAREIAVNLLVRILRIGFFRLDENMVEIHVDNLAGFEQSIFMLSFIRRSLSLGLVLNLNTLPDEDLYSMSSLESSFMARPIVWLVGIWTSGDSRRWHSLLSTSYTQSPP